MGGPVSSGDRTVDGVVDAVCELGCARVRGIIDALDSGETLPEYAGLDAGQRRLLLRELQVVMAVYDRPCEPPAD